MLLFLLISFKKWNDISLRWKKEEYGGVKAIRLDPTRIWTPDLTLYNR